MNIGLYQISYLDSHLKVPAEIKIFDKRQNPTSHLREYVAISELFLSGKFKEHDLTGTISPKFLAKCNISPLDFLNWIKSNPGYDLYLINPFPQMKYLYYDYWDQAESHHPGIQSLTEEVLTSTDIKAALSNFPRYEDCLTSYCNFWVGNTRFWEEFGPFLNTVANKMIKDPQSRFFEDVNHYPAPASYFSFIIERMLTTYLTLAKTNLKVLAYEYKNPVSQSANPSEQRLVELSYPMVLSLDHLIRNFQISPSEAKSFFKRIYSLLKDLSSKEELSNVFRF